MSKRFTITEDEKRQIKGLYLINEDDTSCQNEKFDIVDGTKTIKKQIDRNGLTEYVKGSRKTINVIKYCNGKREHSYEAYIEDGKLVLDQVGA
jgi:hypothetical protein